SAAELIEDTTERAPTMHVCVEHMTEKMTDEPPAVRNATAEHHRDPGDRILRGSVVFDEADQIPRSRQTAADHARIGRAVDDVVDATRLEAAVERDGALIDEPPAGSRNRLSRTRGIIAHGHHVVGTGRIENGIRAMI